MTARPDEELAGCASAHQRLLATLAELDDPTARRDSRLPGWSVAHVVTHLARNADGLARIFEAAARGQVAEQYPGGRQQRDADIEAGASRPAAELRADVTAACERLEAAWEAVDEAAWATGHGRTVAGDLALPEVAFRRWREVEVHWVDLGMGPTCDDWPPGYVRRELARQVMAFRSRRSMGLTELPPAALALPPARRLAWLLGRLAVPGLEDPGAWS